MFPGLEKGLCVPFFKSRVTSRKLTVCLFTSIVILRPFLLKMVQSFFLIRSVCLGVALETLDVGAYLLYLIREEFRDTCNFGLYRDDGLKFLTVSSLV